MASRYVAGVDRDFMRVRFFVFDRGMLLLVVAPAGAQAGLADAFKAIAYVLSQVQFLGRRIAFWGKR